MDNYTNISGPQQPYQAWTALPQSSALLPTQAGFDAPYQDCVLPDRSLHQQNTPYEAHYGYSSSSLDRFDMSTNDLLPDASTELGEQDSCPLPPTSSGRSFSTLLTVESQPDTPLKPYVCKIASCRHPSFSSKACLDRHQREVHERSKLRCCPVVTCKRHTKGFPRKYNLFEHMKRCHPNISSKEQARIREDEEFSGSEATITENVPSSGNMRDKLEKLRAIREEVDSDIRALEQAMFILRDSSF